MTYINNENSNMYAKRFKYSEGISWAYWIIHQILVSNMCSYE